MIANLIEQQKHWFVENQWIRVNAMLSSNEIQEIGTKADIVVEIPLKNGKKKILNMPSLLNESQSLQRYLEE